MDENGERWREERLKKRKKSWEACLGGRIGRRAGPREEASGEVWNKIGR